MLVLKAGCWIVGVYLIMSYLLMVRKLALNFRRGMRNRVCHDDGKTKRRAFARECIHRTFSLWIRVRVYLP